MERKKKKYSKPNLVKETFTSNEYVSVCSTYTIETISSVAGNVQYALDLNKNWLFDSEEQLEGNTHNINPQGKTLTFTESEYQRYLREREQAFYGPKHSFPGTYDKGYYFNEKGGGHGGEGIYIVNSTTVPVKNRS